MGKQVREPVWAGQFYPAEPGRLNGQIEGYLDAAPDQPLPGRLIGLIVPHAGYDYSGATAAAAYRQIRSKAYSTVFLLAPSHVEAFSGVSVYDGDCYRSPLGIVPVDKEAARAVAAAHRDIQLSSAGHGAKEGRAEHSLEVQIPFLQVALGHEFEVVPIVFHDFSVENCRNLGHALAGLLDPGSTLLVASSDLYHGYSYEECVRTDDRTVECIEAMEIEEFCLGAAKGRYLACGAGPIGALLYTASEIGPARVTLAARTNSADVTGVRGGWTVGYASFCVSRAADS